MPGNTTKNPPAGLLALGREPLPATIELATGTYRLDRVFKHDFFAATARYSGTDGDVVLKIGRKAGFCGLPLGWIGRLHARHESAALSELADVPAVPRFVERFGDHGFVHEYVQGHPLSRSERVPDDFFDRLRHSIGMIHDRKMAYVDLEKCENVVVGDDGQPYLVDFQIAWRLSRRFGGDLWPMVWIRRRLQRADLYHVRKLQRRTRPDQLSDRELHASYEKPRYVRVWSTLTRPFTRWRRRVLSRLDPRPKDGERGRV